jgi:hypothetical protein
MGLDVGVANAAASWSDALAEDRSRGAVMQTDACAKSIAVL